MCVCFVVCVCVFLCQCVCAYVFLSSAADGFFAPLQRENENEEQVRGRPDERLV